MTAVLGALAYLGSTWTPLWPARAAIWAAGTVVVLLVGCSRVYLGVHWASDVVGGVALGGLWLAALLATTRTVTDLQATSPARRAPQ